MNGEAEIKRIISELLDSQLFCVLTTNLEGDKFPYSSLIAFLNTEDLKQIYFATSRNTTKFSNLISDPKICIFFDNRTNELGDVSRAITATVLGKVKEIDKNEEKDHVKDFIKKYPQLKKFVEDRRTAFCRIDVKKYVVVYNFHKVLRLEFD
jgi:nitroimidazol reductase NimA-like FMN-containing flavoprotein (pyridoxamine 5'-phosphate oxidase superfamily)